MTWLRSVLGALLLLAGVAQAASAQTTADAKSDGKAFGGSVIDRAKGAATTAPDASRVPGFNPAATQGLEDLADHPDRIEGAARSAATGNTAIRTIEDSMDNRARFSPQEIKSILARSGEISETPLDYTSGMSVSGSKGNCVSLPPGTGSVGTYMATCNTGYTAEQKTATCQVPLEVRADPHPPGTGPRAASQALGQAQDRAVPWLHPRRVRPPRSQPHGFLRGLCRVHRCGAAPRRAPDLRAHPAENPRLLRKEQPMSARRTRTAIMLAAMLGQAVPSAAQDAVTLPGAAATEAGDAFYCGERRLGYWFYCVRPKPAPSQTAEPKSQAPTATAALDTITATLRELKARAIIEPTPENVTAYMR